MALSQAAIKRNRKANKRAKTKTRFFPSAGPSRKEIEKREKSRKNREAAIKSAQTEVEVDIDTFEGELNRAKTFNAKDKVLARFLKRAKVQEKISKRSKDENRENMAQHQRNIKAREAGVNPDTLPLDFKAGGKVYKVNNSGQQMVAKQYGGKIK